MIVYILQCTCTHTYHFHTYWAWHLVFFVWQTRVETHTIGHITQRTQTFLPEIFVHKKWSQPFRLIRKRFIRFNSSERWPPPSLTFSYPRTNINRFHLGLLLLFFNSSLLLQNLFHAKTKKKKTFLSFFHTYNRTCDLNRTHVQNTYILYLHGMIACQVRVEWSAVRGSVSHRMPSIK